MTLPVTFKTWKERQSLCKGWKDAPKGFCYTQKQAIQWSADWLIERLYVPCSLRRHTWGTVTNRHLNQLTKPYDVESEGINWGDLGAHVEKRGKMYVVTLEEAFPESTNLCAYVMMWLNRWGWKNVFVQAEW